MKNSLCNFINKFFLFCSSYSPLLIIFLIYSSKISYINAVICSLLIGGWVALYFNINGESTGKHVIKVCSVENKNDMMHTYLLPYIIFILTSDSNVLMSINKLISIIIFIMVLFIVYINSNLFLFDLILMVFKYKYYEVTSENKKIIVISKKNLYDNINEEIEVKIINDNIFKF